MKLLWNLISVAGFLLNEYHVLSTSNFSFILFSNVIQLINLKQYQKSLSNQKIKIKKYQKVEAPE